MEWLKRIIKCKLRGVHKLTFNSTHCVRCGKEIIKEQPTIHYRSQANNARY